MEAKTKKNLIIWGVVLLVLLNVSSLATIWFHRYQYSNSRMNRHYNAKAMKQHSQRMGGHGAGGDSYFSKGLNLSSTQQSAFDSIWDQYSNIRQEIEQEMAANRQQMSAMMNQLEVDTTKLYRLSADQGLLMQELDLSMIKMNLALRTTLNPEQMQDFLKKIEMLGKRRGMNRQSGQMRRKK